MKKLLLLTVVLMGVIASCSKKDNETAPSTVKESIQGNYSGYNTYVCRQSPLDSTKTNLELAINSQQFHFEKVYVAGIVDSIFGKGTAEQQGLFYAPLTVAYEMHSSQVKNVYAISYRPSKLVVNVQQNNKQRNLSINFSPSNQQTGLIWYNSVQGTLTFSLHTSSVMVDNQLVKHFASAPEKPANVAFSFSIKGTKIQGVK